MGGAIVALALPLTQVLVFQIEVWLSMRHFRTTFIPPPSPNGGGMKRKQHLNQISVENHWAKIILNLFIYYY